MMRLVCSECGHAPRSCDCPASIRKKPLIDARKYPPRKLVVKP